MEEQDKTPEEQLNEVETSNLPKTIQSNDREDAPRSRKENRGTDQ